MIRFDSHHQLRQCVGFRRIVVAKSCRDSLRHGCSQRNYAISAVVMSPHERAAFDYADALPLAAPGWHLRITVA
ncbi:hypothetical protein [Sphingomonas sp. T9W2]|uniref:hypothetical protein n=1 Tax=Sphingomonas sp. T9W2 TaxID=3143183 RepID=UPI0031F4C49A